MTKSLLPGYSSSEKPSIPLFTATNSVLLHKHYPITIIGFTLIIPYPPTEYDTMNNCMRNFQDVISQNELEYGPLWCDEGVYRTAKELQLLSPQRDSVTYFLASEGFTWKRYSSYALVKF